MLWLGLKISFRDTFFMKTVLYLHVKAKLVGRKQQIVKYVYLKYMKQNS